MKKYLKIGIIIITLAITGYLGFMVSKKLQQKKDVAERLETIPSFEFQALDGSLFKESNLKTNKPTVLIYFNSSCDFCQHKAKSIAQQIDTFKEIQLLFISEEPKKEIKAFAENYKLYNQLSITFLHDNTSTFAHRFDINTVPYTVIYNAEGNLIKVHKGQLNANDILRALDKND